MFYLHENLNDLDMPICWWLFFDVFFVQRNQSSFLQTRGFLNPRWTLKKQDNMSHTSYDLSQHFWTRTFEWNGASHTRHTLLFKIYVYKKSKLTCVRCTILLKLIQKHSVKWGVTCGVTRVTWGFSHVKVFFGEKSTSNLESHKFLSQVLVSVRPSTAYCYW